MNQPWAVKYCPQTIKDIQGHNTVLQQIQEYIKTYKKQKKRALLLYGATGCGKTCLIHAIANDLNLEILEVNASDLRNKDSINQVVGSASRQQSLFGKSKIILVDEIDGLAGREDRGGISAISDVIAKSSFPIILTANDPWDKKFTSLRSKTELIGIKTPSYLSITKILKKISEKENLSLDQDILNKIARRAGGDYRSAINDLQSMTSTTNIDDLDDRNKSESILNALLKILKTTQFEIANNALENVDESLDRSILWLEENIPKEYTKPQDLYRAYDALAKADVYRGRIRRWQYWRFLVYINTLITSGVALAKDERYKGFIRYTPSSRILKLWRVSQSNKKRKAIAQKIGKATHASSRRVIQDTMPYLKVILKNNKTQSAILAHNLGLEKEEIAWLQK